MEHYSSTDGIENTSKSYTEGKLCRIKAVEQQRAYVDHCIKRPSI